MNGIIHTHPHIPALAYEYWTKNLNVIEQIKAKFNVGCEQKQHKKKDLFQSFYFIQNAEIIVVSI